MNDEIDTGDRGDDLIEVTVFGISIGTASGWDTYGDNGLMFTDVEFDEDKVDIKKFFGDDVNTLCFDFYGVDTPLIIFTKSEQQIEKDIKEFLKLILELL